jgi:2-dehydropantoate 2-reductase
MRICVVGCGAIGGLFAAHLAGFAGTEPEAEVWAFDVDAARVRAINERGLRIDGGEPVVARIQARTDPGEIPPCDFGIVATKSLFTEPAIAATAALFANAAVCSLQNGLGNEEVLARYVPRVIRGTTILAGSVPAPGVVHVDARGDTWLGPFEPQAAGMAEIRCLANSLNRSGLPTVAMTDSRGPQWTKLIFNAATSPVTALTGLTMGELTGPVRSLVDGLVAEGCAVAEALGITLDGNPLALIDEAAVIARDHRTSMLQDILARRPTEVAVLSGGIIRMARETGVPAPLHESVAALVDGIERSWG